MFGLNKDINKRDEIIFGKYEPELYTGGIRRFDGLNIEQLEQLIEENFINVNEEHNNCPSVKEIFEFMKKYPDYTVMGYTVSIRREDYRVSLDGIEKQTSATLQVEKEEFIILFGNADEFDTVNMMYAWFD